MGECKDPPWRGCQVDPGMRTDSAPLSSGNAGNGRREVVNVYRSIEVSADTVLYQSIHVWSPHAQRFDVRLIAIALLHQKRWRRHLLPRVIPSSNTSRSWFRRYVVDSVCTSALKRCSTFAMLWESYCPPLMLRVSPTCNRAPADVPAQREDHLARIDRFDQGQRGDRDCQTGRGHHFAGHRSG